MPSLDFIGSFFGIISTIAFAFAWIIAWPLSLIAIACDFILYAQLQIPGDACLQIIYAGIFIYGWYAWASGRDVTHPLNMTYLSWRQRLQILILVMSLMPLTTYLLTHYGHSSNPWLDACTTVLSLTAQSLMCRKKIDSWLVWFMTDLIYLKLYWIKGIGWHVLTLPIYMCFGVLGLWRWLELKRKQSNEINTIESAMVTSQPG